MDGFDTPSVEFDEIVIILKKDNVQTWQYRSHMMYPPLASVPEDILKQRLENCPTLIQGGDIENPWQKMLDFTPIPEGKNQTVQCLIRRVGYKHIEMAYWDTVYENWNDDQDDDHLYSKDTVEEWKYVQ